MTFKASPPVRFLGAALLISILAGPLPASAEPEKHTLRLEGAAALMVGRQVDRFDLSGGLGLSYEYRLVDHLGLEARYSAFFFPEAEAGRGPARMEIRSAAPRNRTGGEALKVIRSDSFYTR